MDCISIPQNLKGLDIGVNSLSTKRIKMNKIKKW